MNNVLKLSDIKCQMSREKSLLPDLQSDSWYTFTPKPCKSASFEKTDGALISRVDSDEHFGMAKWCCTVPIEFGKHYNLYVPVKTESHYTDCHAIWKIGCASVPALIANPLEHFEKTADGYEFYDHVYVDEGDFYNHMTDKPLPVCREGVTLTVELWLKGYHEKAVWGKPYLVATEPLGERLVKIAIAYINPSTERKGTLEDNVRTICECVDRCGEHNPDLVVLSEAMYDRFSGVHLSVGSHDEFGELPMLLKEKCRKYGTYICYNYHEADKEAGTFHNASLLFDRNGETVGKYRKTHLTVGEHENGMLPGDSYPVFETDFGKVGMLICYDHYFIEPPRKIVENGAEIICIATAGDADDKCIARAMDNGVYLAVGGLNKENDYGWGPGRIVAPDGTILADTFDTMTPAVAEIDLNSRKHRNMTWLARALNSNNRSVYKYAIHEF